MFDWEPFTKELTALINKYSIENICGDIPDYILSDAIVDYIGALGVIVSQRDYHNRIEDFEASRED